MGFFNSEWKASPLGKQLQGYYGGLMQQPNWGYDSQQGQLLEGARAKSLDTSKNSIRNLYASMGQGMKSPQMLRSLSKAQGDINTAYDTKKFDDESQWRNQTMQGAGQAAMMGQYQPSTFSSMMSPAMMGMGLSLGPKMGSGMADMISKGWGGLGKGFDSLTSLSPQMGGAAMDTGSSLASGFGAGEEAASGILSSDPTWWDSIVNGFNNIGNWFSGWGA